MPSMDDWDDLGTHLKFLVTTKHIGSRQRIIIEVFKD